MAEIRQGEFALSVGEWAAKAKANADQVLRATVIGLLNNLVTRSPVGNPDLWKGDKYGFIRPPPGYVGGRFRANWQVSVGVVPRATFKEADPSGQVSIVRASATINGMQCGPPVYIVNNLPYAIPLEYGHSSQQPHGIVRLAVVEYQKIVSDAVQSLS